MHTQEGDLERLRAEDMERDMERDAFRAGFLAVLENGRHPVGGGPREWRFNGLAALDLEPEAWAAWVEQRETVSFTYPVPLPPDATESSVDEFSRLRQVSEITVPLSYADHGGEQVRLDNRTLFRFWEKVRVTDTCWEWTAAKSARCGHGIFGKNGTSFGSHRIAWIIAHGSGSITPGFEVCHRCDNGSCVRPSHLFVASHRENMKDMSRKGRGTTANRGEGSARSHLTTEEIRLIRQLSADGVTRAELARRYGIKANSVSRIVLRTRWQHVA